MIRKLDLKISQEIARGSVIPAHPLALTAERRLDRDAKGPSRATT